MKRVNLYALFFGVGLVFLVAASSRGTPLPQQQENIGQQQAVAMSVSFVGQEDEEEEVEEQTFQGTISKADGKFVLVGEDSVTYHLSDQEKAEPFEGKKVNVTGKLDKNSMTIHVSDITEVSDEDSEEE